MLRQHRSEMCGWTKEISAKPATGKRNQRKVYDWQSQKRVLPIRIPAALQHHEWHPCNATHFMWLLRVLTAIILIIVVQLFRVAMIGDIGEVYKYVFEMVGGLF